MNSGDQQLNQGIKGYDQNAGAQGLAEPQLPDSQPLADPFANVRYQLHGTDATPNATEKHCLTQARHGLKNHLASLA